MTEIVKYAVIFSSRRSNLDELEYRTMASHMEDLARKQSGFLGMESVRGDDGQGITISYWQSLADISNWKGHVEHTVAQKLGRERWYDSFEVRICRVEREYGFERV